MSSSSLFAHTHTHTRKESSFVLALLQRQLLAHTHSCTHAGATALGFRLALASSHKAKPSCTKQASACTKGERVRPTRDRARTKRALRASCALCSARTPLPSRNLCALSCCSTAPGRTNARERTTNVLCAMHSQLGPFKSTAKPELELRTEWPIRFGSWHSGS